ncbi:hypothetical protein WA026_013658 [Henosepilachna vigintioctopunctata]|uniref:Uncharacterized protein n=1 Tax=Henosepilachna vigintioctopunctata TaxID=420089 RepID=A0AAW1UY42_9CUCU
MSDLKYLLRNKSDNSVLINRSNVSTDLLQQNLTLLADSKYWHGFVIHNVKNPKKNCILKTVLDYVFPLHLIPVHFKNIGTVCMFLARNCADAVLKLCKDGLVIPYTDNSTNLYTCEIVLRYATIDTFKHDVKTNISTVLESLFDEKTKTLNLENFSNNIELTEYSPLSQPKILYFVLHLAKKLKPIKINLRNNEIRRVFPLDVLSGATTLEELDLRNNMISNIDEMKNLKLLNLTELWLDGNPLCDDYEELAYINTLRGIFPLLERLDGVTVKKKGDVIIKRNFLCSPDGFDIVNQFIEHFFQIYDYDRTLLEDLYHSNAVFSITTMFKRGTVTSGTPELDSYEVLNRNLLNLSNSNKNKKMLVKGNVEIVKKLEGLPKTNHDAYSFCIDLIHYTDTSATISVTGVFLNEAFAKGESVKHTHVARTSKDKERAIEAIQLVTRINKEWSKRLLADASYDVDRFFKTFMKLLKLDKVPEEAYRSKGNDKDAFLKWIVGQMSPTGVQNFKSPLREEILEYLSERSMLLSTSDAPLEPNCAESTPSNNNTTSDPKELEEELWLQKYENLNLNLISKQSSTVYDSVSMEFSDDDEANQTFNICQSGDSVPSSQLYNVDAIRNYQNQYQSSRYLLNQYGLNNVEVGQDQTLSSPLYVPHKQISFNIKHTANPNLVSICTNMQTTLNSKMNPSVTLATEFIPPLPQEECAPPLPQEVLPPLPQEVLPPLPQEVLPPLPQEVLPPLPQEEVIPPLPQEEVIPPLPRGDSIPFLSQDNGIHALPQLNEYTKKMEEVSKLESEKKEVEKIKILFSRFKAHLVNTDSALPVNQSLTNQYEIAPSVTDDITLGVVACITNNNSHSRPNPPASSAIIVSEPYEITTGNTDVVRPHTEPKKKWNEVNKRNNLIYVSKIQSVATKCNEAKENDKFETEVTQNGNVEVQPFAAKSTCLEKDNSWNAVETESFVRRSPSIILSNDVIIPPNVYVTKNITEKEKKRLNMRPPTITLLKGKWINIEQNDKMAFRLVYGKWILMEKNTIGEWQEVQDDFIKESICWRKHFPSYQNEILNHTLSASCLKSFVKTSFDSIPDPVTYWDFSASVPYDLRPPQMKTLILTGVINRIHVTPESGFGFISVQGKWVLLAKNEYDDHWIVLTEKGKHIAWINGKWTFGEISTIQPENKISVKRFMPKLGLFSKKWVPLPTTTMTFKFLFGYWVLFRKNDFGRWNVARDDFAEDFVCKKKHFPGDREPIPNPKEGTWKQPSNFHTARLSCLPSFDKTIFDSIGFPVTSYHFLPTVPEDLLPPKRCLLLDHASSKYVEKDINPDSNYGFISINGEWKIREKTDHGTWISVDMKPIEPRENSSTYPLDQENITNLSKVGPASITPNKFNGTSASCDEEFRQIPQEDNQNESASKEKCDKLINQELEKSSDKNIRSDCEKEMNIGERFVKSATLTSSKDYTLKNTCEDKLQLVNEGKPVENKTHEDENIPDGFALGSSAVTDSVIDTDQISQQTNICTETSVKSQGPVISQKNTDIHNTEVKSGISLGSASHSHITDVSCVNIDNTVLKSIEEETTNDNTSCRLHKICTNYEFPSVANETEHDRENINEPFSHGCQALNNEEYEKAGPVIEPKMSDDAKAINRLKRLNAWKKTIQLAPSIPKLTLLNDKWIIVDEDPCLKFREFGIGTWQLLELHSDGQWKILKDDFILAKEKSKNPNNLEEYMSLIGENKFESIPIPVTNYDFPSSVPKSLRPPLVIEYKQKLIEINANSGYACLVHGRNWILLKQDEQGKWLSLDEKYQNYVEEKLKNTPEKYLSNVRPFSKRMYASSSHSVDYMQKISAAICPFIELLTGDIPGTIIKPLTYWDVDGEEKVRPPKFALAETDGKTQWFGVRPNLGFGFVLEDGVWVLVQQTEYNEWNNLKINSYDGYILGYFLINNRWAILKKYIFGGQWEPLFDYKTTPCNYWDFIGPEEEKPPRNILFSGKKKSKIIHKNSGMGFLKKGDMWILMENKNNKWSAVKDVEYECAYKLIDSIWVAYKKHSGGKWVPIPNSSPKILTYWNFMGLPELAPPRRIIFKENGIKTEKIIDEKSGLGFVLDKGIWVLVKEGDNGELIHVNHWEGASSQIGFEPRDGKFMMISKDEFGNWNRSTIVSDAHSTQKRSYTPVEYSFGGEFSKPIPVTFYDVPSHIPEHMRPPKYGCLESLKWERIRKNSGYGFIFENDMWRLMKWIFGRGWLFLEDIVDMLILGYKGIDGRWVPMKKENNEWKPLFDPFSTPRVIEQCYGASSEKPPSRVTLDGVNILDINLGTKLGFLKESDVWILMKHQGGNQWKRFEYFNDENGIYGYKRVQGNFELVKKNENGNWLRVYWDWNSAMWSYNKSVSSKEQSSNEKNASENVIKKRKSLPTLFSQENIADIMSSYDFYLNSLLDKSFEKENMAPVYIETGIDGYLQNSQVSKMKDVSFSRLCDIWLLLVHDDCGWFMPNDCLGYKLINHRWVSMRKDPTGSWLPTQEPIYSPKSFSNTVGSARPPKRIIVYIDGVTKWMEVGHDLNLGFIENDEVFILVKRNDGDWEVMTDDLEESPMLAFKIINHRWKRVKKNEFDDWIPCSTDVLLPILICDALGPEGTTPPPDFHIIGEDGIKKYKSYSFSNIGFQQEDGIWVVMHCHEDNSWSRHAGTYNNKEEYGYKYMNFKYILMKKDKKENSTWLAAEIESQTPSLKTSINEGAGNMNLKRTDDEGTDTVDIKIDEVEKLIHKKVSTTKHSEQREFLKISETPIDYDDYLSLPKKKQKKRPPCYITKEKDGREECVKISKEKGEAFIKRDDMWVYVKREYGRWFIVNNYEGYKLMDNRWVLMKQCTNGSWLPAFDPNSTPRTFYDTVDMNCPQRVILCKNGNFEWVIISSSTNLGFINEAGAWILMKKESNGEWAAAKDDLEDGSRLCFKLVENKWQRVKKNDVGIWIPSSKQPSLPVQHSDIIGRAEKPPLYAFIVTKNGETKSMILNADSPMGYIQEDGVWILMYLENMVWSEYKMFDEKYTYGHKRIYGKWILMKKENDKWIPGMKLATKWTFPETKKKSKMENISSIMDLELAEMISSTPKPFSYFNGFSQFERPPQSLVLVENGICKRVSFLKDIKYGFHKHNGVWVLMKQDISWKFAQYSADGLLGHKLIDKRFVVMKRIGNGDWICTFNPYKTPRNFYDTVGRKFQRPPLRIVLKENGVHRWKIVSEENGLGFIGDKSMWILMQKLSNQAWTKYTEDSPDEEIGYKIVGNTWKKFKRCAPGEWTNCTQVNLPILYCDIPVENGLSTPKVLFHSPRKLEITKRILGDPNSNFGFLLEDGAWVFMKCEENGTWSKFDLFPGEKGTFGYTINSLELVKKDSNNKWKVIIKKSGRNGMYLDFNIEESAEPPAKKIRLNQELTKTQNSSIETVHSNSSEISLAKNSGLAYLKNLLSTQTPFTLKQLNEESRENCPPSNILINTNGTLKRISLSTYVTDVAFLKDNGVWIPVRKLEGEWKTFHSEEELLGYKIIDDRWVIMKNIRNNEWEPTFDPVSTPRNYFDTIGTLDRKPPIRIVIKENRINKWKIVAEENGLGFIKQGVVWVVMTKIGESWVEVKDCTGEKVIGYEVKNFKWTKVEKGIDGIWRSCSNACLPCLHWDYIRRDKTVPPKALPIQVDSCKIIKHETIKANSNKGFDMENGAWVLKESKSDGTWQRVNIYPKSDGIYGFMYKNGWKIVRKGSDGKWIESNEIFFTENESSVQETVNNSLTFEKPSLECCQSEIEKKIDSIPSVGNSGDRDSVAEQESIKSKEGCSPEKSPRDVVIYRPVSYDSLHNVADENKPPNSVLINIDGTSKRIFSNEKSTKIGFQKQGDIWILIEKHNGMWRAVQNIDGELLGFKVMDNRWVNMRKNRKSEWLPSFDPVTTPRTFFDTVGPLSTRPPMIIKIQKDGITQSQTASEENGFGFIKQHEMWLLMEKRADQLWTVYKNDSNQQTGYQFVNNKWSMFQKKENSVWSLYSPSAQLNELSDMISDKEKNIKPKDISEKNSTFHFSENLDVDGLLSPLTSNDIKLAKNVALPFKEAKATFVKTDPNISINLEKESGNGARVDDKLPLNAVEIYLAANPDYEISCPELQDLLLEFRPRDKPKKLIRRRFRLPDGKTILLTIPKNSAKITGSDRNSNDQILKEAETFLATHSTRDWASPDFMEILCKFKLLDSKAPSRCDILFPDGVKRPLSLPRKTDRKSEAIQKLGAELEVILRSYKSHVQLASKRKISEGEDLNISRKKVKIKRK